MTNQRIDLDAVSELKEILEDEFSTLISTYIKDTKQKLDLLSEAVKERNAPEVREVAHSIKGASINIGIVQLSELCQQMETVAKEGAIDEFDQLLPPIQDEVHWVLQALIEI
ncbi:MAG: Hpt domain-containing protein [Reinekea sp.]|jgi:histidine phosphotransfer protein HptB